MARKKKNSLPVPSGGGERMSTDISTAENGFIVNVSGDSGGKNPSYFSKRFVASSRPDALRIAAHHISGAVKGKGGKRKGKSHSFKKSAT